MILKFFLADDHQDDIDLFREALFDINPSIAFNFASNGKELVPKLQLGKLEPEIIFLDINMPGMNGWECLEVLKSKNELKDIPVIMYSTSSSGMDGKKALNLGALCFYEKPPNFLRLREFLNLIVASAVEDLKETLKEIERTRIHRLYI